MDYFPMLIAGDPAGLLSLFAGEPLLDDPRAGRVQGRSAFENFVRDSSRWLKERHGEVEPIATTITPARIVQEYILHLQQDQEPIALPVALAADFSQLSAPVTPATDAGYSPRSEAERDAVVASGAKQSPDQSDHSDHSGHFDHNSPRSEAEWDLDQLRIYHSQWPLLKAHRLRPPILPARHDLTLSGAVARYQDALAHGDLETILDQFEPDGYAREPAGGQYIHRGPAELRQFYGALFANGGIPLEHCTVTDDGVRCAVEYNVTNLGRIAISPQSGIAIYERGPSGLLAAARIYDDVDLP